MCAHFHWATECTPLCEMSELGALFVKFVCSLEILIYFTELRASRDSRNSRNSRTLIAYNNKIKPILYT